MVFPAALAGLGAALGKGAAVAGKAGLSGLKALAPKVGESFLANAGSQIGGGLSNALFGGDAGTASSGPVPGVQLLDTNRSASGVFQPQKIGRRGFG